MPEVLNPNLSGRNGSGDQRAVMVFGAIVLAILVGVPLFGYLKTAATTRGAESAAMSSSPADMQGTAVNRGQVSPADFGWLTVLAEPLYLALRFVHGHGVGNWGWSIIVLTVIFNLLMLWPRLMAVRSSLRTMRLQPKVEALKGRYAHLAWNDPKRTEMNAGLTALYKAEGANMYGGCLPMLLQTPLFLAYFRVLHDAVELHGAHWLWLADLSLPDPLHILPLVIIATMLVTQLITPAPGMDPKQRKMLAFAMPVVMGFTLWRYASGLALYWATGNLLSLVFQFGVNRTRMGRELLKLAATRAGRS